MNERSGIAADTIDVADVARTLRRQWRAMIVCVALGIAGAGMVLLFATRRFEGKSTILAKGGSTGGTSIINRITGVGDLLGGLSSLTGASGLETELQVLRSRALAGEVVDSLQLQVRVREPEGTAATAVVTRSEFVGAFAPRTLRIERVRNGSYRATWNDSTFQADLAKPLVLDVGSITFRGASLPPKLELRVLDREDAITRYGKRLNATKAGGDVAKIVFQAEDSVTAAAATNALVEFYLRRRKTLDRGVNQRRVEFVAAQLDSTAQVLAETERALRQYQEASGIINAEEVGKIEIEGSSLLRQRLTDVQVDEATITQLLVQADAGRITSRDLAAFPGFLRGTAVSPLMSQLSELEARRIRLLERRTERDPEVQAIDTTMRVVEANIVAMARSYAGSIRRQRTELQGRVDSLHRSMLAIPAAAERGGRLQRDVERLTAIYTALQAQLVEARLATVGEGGDVRQMDFAVPPRTAAFPKPMLTMGIGIASGLLAGMVVSLLLGWFGRWLRDPVEIERAVGVIAERFRPDAPLLMAGAPTARTVLVVPLNGTAYSATVAERLARTARQRAIQATVVDLSASLASGNGKVGTETIDVSAMIDKLEQENAMVIVQMPELGSEVTFAALRATRPVLLVAPPGPVERARLSSAVDTLRRLQVPCAGVVISDAPGALP
jgi:uncharacterized protein involved in exopolysaccharide biosynthesis